MAISCRDNQGCRTRRSSFAEVDFQILPEAMGISVANGITLIPLTCTEPRCAPSSATPGGSSRLKEFCVYLVVNAKSLAFATGCSQERVRQMICSTKQISMKLSENLAQEVQMSYLDFGDLPIHINGKHENFSFLSSE